MATRCSWSRREGEEITYADAVARIARVADTLAARVRRQQGRPGRPGVGQHRRVHPVLLGDPRARRDPVQLQRLVDHPGAGARHRAHRARRRARRRATPGTAGETAGPRASRRPGRRWCRWRPRPPRGCTSDGPDVPHADVADRRGRPGHHPVHQRHDRAFQGRGEHPSQLGPLRPDQHRRGRRRDGGRRRRARDAAAKAPQPSAIFAAPIFHISGSGPLTNAPASGMKLVLPPPGRWDETVTLELVQKHRITTLSGVPTQFWRILQHPEIDSYDLSSVQTIGGGGAVFPPELARLHVVQAAACRGRSGLRHDRDRGHGHAARRAGVQGASGDRRHRVRSR